LNVKTKGFALFAYAVFEDWHWRN